MPKHPTSPPYKSSLVVSKSKETEKHMTTIPKPIVWGILGWLVYLLTDFYIWYIVMGSRTYDGPINSTLFFLWFCLSPGFAQFSYVALMLEKENEGTSGCGLLCSMLDGHL
ncbi:MAG: hypothetical protein GPJ51_09150 [Candidatus Heimdallarchaeota archaeon]|nr:hypothetical protein [Candidatus Heimdallarchaeota archaeon]